MLQNGTEVVLSKHHSAPVGATAKVISIKNGPVSGGRQTQLLKIRFDSYKPVVELDVRDTQVIPVEDATEEGWFYRWEYLHRTGWRHYSLEESHIIQEGYEAGKKMMDMRGGKLGRNYTITYHVQAAGVTAPHMGCQLSGTSGIKRAVRRLLFDPSGIDPESIEGWKLRWARLPANCVAEFFTMSSVMGGDVLTREQAVKLLDDNVREKEWSAAYKQHFNTPQLQIERARYRGIHINKFCEANGRDKVVVWEWYHGKTARAWKAYCGAECDLLEKALEDLDYALLNGGKPFKEFPSRPLKILFGQVWTKEGKVFAFHTQKDLITKNRRGVRRKVKAPDSRDFMYYHWLHQYKKASALDMYKVYNEYINDIVKDPENGYAAAQKKAQEKMKKLNALSAWAAPPQEDIPDEFVCPLKLSLMIEPAYSCKTPKMHRVEKELLTKWVSTRHNNPMTREAMIVSDITVDTSLEEQMTKWMWSFNRTKPPKGGAKAAPPAEAASAAGAAAAAPLPKPELSGYSAQQLAQIKIEVHRVLSRPENKGLTLKSVREAVSKQLNVDFDTSQFRKWFRKTIREFADKNKT